LGLVLGKLTTPTVNARLADLVEMSQALERQRVAVRNDISPLVSIVLWDDGEIGRGEDFAARAETSIASVVAQEYRELELIIVGAGAVDAVSEAVFRCVAEAAFPFRLLPGNSSATVRNLNLAIAAASGTYIALLRAGDTQAPERIAVLVEEIPRRCARWGFSLVAGANAAPTSSVMLAPCAVDVTTRQRIALGTPPASRALVGSNVAMVPGNLFAERALFDELGGFHDVPHHWDWDFSLRATRLAEPVVVQRPLYRAAAGAGDCTWAGAADATRGVAPRVVSDFLTATLAMDGAINPLALQHPANRSVLLSLVFGANLGALVPVEELRTLALGARTRSPAQVWRSQDAPAISTATRTAVIVLGMHRSGTSATARVLNLCGAHLPLRMMPAKPGVNAKGFWEPEAVIDLDSRVMQQLGGDWARVEFTVPETGEVVDEFLSGARELVASEYGTAPTILIKDPRIGVLAPLWDRVLHDAGFRTTWVIPIRNPLEVARSLHARGDMGVREGLALWLAYMRRIRDFSRGRDDVIFFTYEELLADWRAVIARIVRRLGVPLDAIRQAAEVDRFLDRDLRHQVADEALLASLPGEPVFEELRATYRECQLRCASDAREGVGAAAIPKSAPDLSFVLCIENNGLREQALLLCESLRRYGGRHRQARVVAFAPRPGLGVDRETRAQLADLEVDYVDEPLNTSCPAYGTANRIFAGAYAEAQLDSDLITVLDSDTLVLDEIDLPTGYDAAVRPVDEKGSATRGPGDPFEPYWERMASLAGIALDRLPRVRTTITGDAIRASYNGGFAVVRRSAGILTRCAQVFAASLEAGWRPYAGAGIAIHASTGDVGREGSEFWGSSQTALALAIWATTERVLHASDRYNVPLHLIAAGDDIDPRWLRAPPAHVHYHWMFDARTHEVALEILARLGVATEPLRWIRSRIPLSPN
ncbi:MAG: hypothetical protein ACREX6_07910, partial [Casimicrobiaceae bacterium]